MSQSKDILLVIYNSQGNEGMANTQFSIMVISGGGGMGLRVEADNDLHQHGKGSISFFTIICKVW